MAAWISIIFCVLVRVCVFYSGDGLEQNSLCTLQLGVSLYQSSSHYDYTTHILKTKFYRRRKVNVPAFGLFHFHRNSFFVIFLLLGGDIEANPGPITLFVNNEVDKLLWSKNSCLERPGFYSCAIDSISDLYLYSFSVC